MAASLLVVFSLLCRLRGNFVRGPGWFHIRVFMHYDFLRCHQRRSRRKEDETLAEELWTRQVVCVESNTVASSFRTSLGLPDPIMLSVAVPDLRVRP